MRKILLCVVVILLPAIMQAQTPTFAVADTVKDTILKILAPTDNITNITGSSLTLNWHVDTTDFPADWLTAVAFGICDNYECRNNTGSGSLWNQTTKTGTSYTSHYGANSTHDSLGGYDISLDFSSVTTLGTHWITINIADNGSAFNKNITFVISKLVSTVGVANVANADHKMALYPNPAKSSTSLSFNLVQLSYVEIRVIDQLGRTCYHVATNMGAGDQTIALPTDELPAGIYMVQMQVNGESVTQKLSVTK